MDEVSVVMITRNRRTLLPATLDRLAALPERPAVIVVDNGSTDGTAPAVRRGYPRVRVIRLPHNAGAAGRTVGVRAAVTPYVAFADDDTWWEPGALAHAARLFAAAPRLGLVAGQVLVRPGGRPDPTCALMADSPLGRDPDLPGPSVLGFLAGGAVVRRRAFLAVGGFTPLLGIGGEEGPLALELARAGWGLAYVAEVVAHHEPAAVRPDRMARRRRELRNEIWSALLHRPASVVARRVARLAGRAVLEPVARAALLEAAAGAPAVLRRRSVVADPLERRLRLVEAGRAAPAHGQLPSSAAVTTNSRSSQPAG